MQPPSPLPDPSPQIHQQHLDYPPLPPVALAALALVVEALRTRWRTHQLTWLCIPQGSGMQGGVGPRQEGAYVYLPSLSFVACVATSFVHAPSFVSAPGRHPVHSPPQFVASFLRLHPLPVLPHLCMPMHCCLCSHPLIQACMCLCCHCACVCAHLLLLYCHN
jgi:hypothetical protein